jgi:hypothetical protein
MSVTGTRKASAAEVVSWAGEQVTIPRAAVEHVQLRSLDKRRTTGVAILAILAAVAVKVIVNSASSSAGGDEGGTPVTPP